MRRAFLVLVFFYIVTSSVFAYSQLFTTKTVTKNNTLVVDLAKSPTTKLLYESGKLHFEVQEKDIATVVKRGQKLLLHFYNYTYTGKLTLIVKNQTDKKQTTLSVNIQKSDSNFTLRDDLLYLSLQKKKLSCESSAAADIASHFLQKHISEDTIISLLPRSAKGQAIKEGKQTIWGNPEQGFVGFIDVVGEEKASQKKLTGYGVYEKPIAQTLKELGLKTSVINAHMHSSEFTPTEHRTYLLEKLKSGALVELWGDWCTKKEFEDGVVEKEVLTYEDSLKNIQAKNECYDVEKPRELKWKYKNEKGDLVEHVGLAGEHTFILLGWEGNIKNPTHIYVWDTDTGYHKYALEEWMRKWEKMEYRSLVVEK